MGFDWNVNDVRQHREDNVQGRYDYKSLSDYVAGTSAATVRPC